MSEKNNAWLHDDSMFLSAGIDPKTRKPTRVMNPLTLKSDMKKRLRIMDEQTAINRYVWYNCPPGLNGQLIERILYYRGQGMLFWLNDKFFFLPYALSAPENSTGIDVYGRFTGVTPLPFNGTSTDGKNDQPWIQGKIFEPIYDVLLPEEFADYSAEELQDYIGSHCVLIKDYTEQVSQTNISRQVLNDPLLDIMAECFPFMRTALINSTGVNGMRVNTEGEYVNVFAANSALYRAAIEGEPNVPIIGKLDFQGLREGSPAKAEEFLLAMQALDNHRLASYGLQNGGLFQKKSHVLEAEQEMNVGVVSLINKDGLENRQRACRIFQSLTGIPLWCECSESELNADIDGTGIAGDDNAMPKEMPKEEEEDAQP